MFRCLLVGVRCRVFSGRVFAAVSAVGPIVSVWRRCGVWLDQLTKNIVVAVMAEGQSIPIIPNIFHLTYILNPGAAFGMFAHNRTFFICVALLVLIIVWWFRKEILAEPLCVRAGTALFIGGAVGNLIDRAENGMVVDFFDFRIWPIFNVADIAICVGVGFIIWNLIQTEILKK